MQFPFLKPFTTMVTRTLADRLVPAGVEYLDMFHDDATFEFPYLSDGPVSCQGKPAMAAFLETIRDKTDFEEFVLDSCRRMEHDAVILEYHCYARDRASGKPYPQRYIAVLRLKGELLSLLREYNNPLVNLSFTGRGAP